MSSYLHRFYRPASHVVMILAITNRHDQVRHHSRVYVRRRGVADQRFARAAGVRFYLHAPIAPPRLWVASLDEESPPGFMRMLSATIPPIKSGSPSKIPGTALVPSKDIDGLRSQVQRLLLAFERCDEASRLEVIKIAERLGGIA
jgi:hypothetical protein